MGKIYMGDNDDDAEKLFEDLEIIQYRCESVEEGGHDPIKTIEEAFHDKERKILDKAANELESLYGLLLVHKFSGEIISVPAWLRSFKT